MSKYKAADLTEAVFNAFVSSTLPHGHGHVGHEEAVTLLTCLQKRVGEGDLDEFTSRMRGLGSMLRYDTHDAYIMRLKAKLKHWSFPAEEDSFQTDENGDPWFKKGDKVVWFYEWGRDCDLMEGDSIELIPADYDFYVNRENDVYDNAEGPCHCSVISQKDADKYVPYRRDIAAEQMGY